MKTQRSSLYTFYYSVHGATFYFNSLTAKPENNIKNSLSSNYATRNNKTTHLSGLGSSFGNHSLLWKVDDSHILHTFHFKTLTSKTDLHILLPITKYITATVSLLIKKHPILGLQIILMSLKLGHVIHNPPIQILYHIDYTQIMIHNLQ